MELTWLRVFGPIVLSVAAAWSLDWMMARRGLLPPYFQLDAAVSAEDRAARLGRRLLAGGILAVILWLGVFSPLGSLGQEVVLCTQEQQHTMPLLPQHLLLS